MDAGIEASNSRSRWQRYGLRIITAGLVFLAVLPGRSDAEVTDDQAAAPQSTSVAADTDTSAPEEAVAAATATSLDQTEALDPATTANDGPVTFAQISQGVTNRFDLARYLPGWRLAQADLTATTPSFHTSDDQTIFVRVEAARSVDELVLRALHEVGHVIDEVRLTDEQRFDFSFFRSHNPALSWKDFDTGTTDNHVESGAEDFAEVFVAWVMGGNYITASQSIAGQPTADELQTFCQLIQLEGVAC